MSVCLLSVRGERDVAKDLAQEVFLRAFQGLAGLSEAGRLRPWLLAITRNVCRDHASRRSRELEQLEAFALEQALDLDAAEVEDPNGRVQAVRRLLAEIADPRVKEIVGLKYGEPEHTTRQIAERLGIPHGTVTVKLMRFRAAAKRTLVRMLLESEVRA